MVKCAQSEGQIYYQEFFMLWWVKDEFKDRDWASRSRKSRKNEDFIFYGGSLNFNTFSLREDFDFWTQKGLVSDDIA